MAKVYVPWGRYSNRVAMRALLWSSKRSQASDRLNCSLETHMLLCLL
jgi:hypothetical protein